MIRETGFLVSEPFLPFTAFLNKNISAPIHWHDYIELLYVIFGEAMITVDGKVFTVTQGDFLIINSRECHASHFFDDIPSEILVIQFEPSTINSISSSQFDSKYILPFLQHGTIYPKVIKLESDSGLKFLLNEILDEFSTKQPGYELSVKGNIFKIFSWLIRKRYITVMSDSSPKTPNLLRLKDLFEFVEQNYKEDISSKSAANMLCMSYHYFCRFFKRATDKTFIEYLNFVRLREAEIHLLSSNASITEIALNAGFESVTYFNRLFKKDKGLSPLSFRKQICSRKSQ